MITRPTLPVLPMITVPLVTFSSPGVEFGPQVFLRLVVLAGGDNDSVFHRRHDNLRINALLPAQGVDRIVKLTRHRKTGLGPQTSAQTPFC